MKFAVKFRDIHKTEKKRLYHHQCLGYENKEKFPIYISKSTFKRHLLLM